MINNDVNTSIDERKVYQEIIQEIVTSDSDDYSVLSKLLNLALDVTPEADYGSVSIIVEDSWRFIDAVGHDAKRLKELTLEFTKYDKERGSDIFVVDNLLEVTQDVKTGSDLDNYLELIKASKPIKSTVEIIARNGDNFLGQITLDIAAESDKSFSKESIERLKIYRDTLRMILTYKENTATIDRYDNVIGLFNEHTNQLSSHKSNFIDDFVDLIFGEIPESSRLLFAAFKDDEISIEKNHGFDDYVYELSKYTKNDFLNILSGLKLENLGDNVYYHSSKDANYLLKLKQRDVIIRNEALIAVLKNEGEHLGFIFLQAEDTFIGSYSRKSKRLFKLLSRLISTYFVLYKSNMMIDNFEKISNLLKKLMSSVIDQDDTLLKSTLETAVDIIPEAESGSVSGFEDGFWRFKYTVGHDLEALSKIDIKKEHCVQIKNITDKSLMYNDSIALVSDFDKYREEKIPEETKKKFIQAVKPATQAAYMQYYDEEENIGNFSIEIPADKNITFSESSLRILDALSNIIYAYFGFRNFVKKQNESQNEIELLNRELEERVRQRTAELNIANQRLQELVAIDGLTNLYNRRHFEVNVHEKWQSALRHDDDFAIVMIDIDYFKPYNDHYGHLQGDKCLQRVSKILLRHFRRADDYVARYGGEEFVVVISKTDADEVVKYVEQFIQKIRDERIIHEFSCKGHITVSAGIAFKDDDAEFNTCLKRADDALYQAKEDGKDRVVVNK